MKMDAVGSTKRQSRWRANDLFLASYGALSNTYLYKFSSEYVILAGLRDVIPYDCM